MGRFSIVRELGRGGFGIVFLAFDPVLRRELAIKVPRPEVMVTPDFRRRFLREAEAASRLDHPHIVPVYEVGEEGPICYIASAYCEGLTLAEWLRGQQAPVPILAAARLVSVVAAAVAHAHERSILHRDLKPGNILLQRSEASPSATEGACRGLGFIPRICDFGLAKLLDQASQETCSGVAIGSASYMAPEQAAGRLREHGPATDVYALGAILYELLTGRPPFKGETDLETLRLVSDQEPPPPRALRPALPRDLETITLKCLEKGPARRYSSASDLTQDLQRFLDGRAVQARPVPAWEHARKWARRRPIHAALAVVLGTGVLAVLGGLESARVREKQHHDELRIVHEHSRQSETEARDQRGLADLLAYHHRAANQLNLASSLVDRGDFGPALSVLENLRPPQRLTDSRGFAWNYLNRLLRPRVAMLPGLPETVRAVANRGDGRLIALADWKNNTFLVDRDTGTLKELPHNHKVPWCSRLVFSPDGRLLASLSHGTEKKNEVKVWDVDSGVELGGMPENLGFCYQVLFSPDGESLVTVEAFFTNREAPVRSWRVLREGKRFTLDQSLRADQLGACLSAARRGNVRAGQPFRLSDVLTMTPDDFSAKDIATMAVSLEGGEIELYRAGSGYCTAICRIVGPDVVFVPRHRPGHAVHPGRSGRNRSCRLRLDGACTRQATLCGGRCPQGAILSRRPRRRCPRKARRSPARRSSLHRSRPRTSQSRVHVGRRAGGFRVRVYSAVRRSDRHGFRHPRPGPGLRRLADARVSHRA